MEQLKGKKTLHGNSEQCYQVPEIFQVRIFFRRRAICGATMYHALAHSKRGGK